MRSLLRASFVVFIGDPSSFFTVKEKGSVRPSARNVKFGDVPIMNLQFMIANNVCLLKEGK